MRLSDLRNLVANIANYDPDVESYRDEIDRLIRSAYYEMYATRTWNFAQVEYRSWVYEDRTATDATVTNGSANITTAGNFFTADMEGMVVETPDGSEYEIVKVASPTSAYLTTIYTGVTVVGTAEIVVKHRYIDLPSNCTSAMQVGFRPLLSASSPSPGRYTPIARVEGEWWNLALNETGDPTGWVPFDDAFVQAPIKAPVSGNVPGAWPAGDYEFAYTYVKQGRESALSPSTTVTLDGVQAPQIGLPNTTANSGITKRIYLKYGSYDAWRVWGSDVAETVTSMTWATPPADDFEFQPRHPGNDGSYQRISLYPRQSSKTEITVRYLARPQELLEDADSPSFPAAHHQWLVYKALFDIYSKHDQPSYAKLYEGKAQAEFVKMEQRYLSTEARRWVKGSFEGDATLYRRNPYGPLTHS